MIYLDTAATSYQKPQSVYDRAEEAMRRLCANPGRSGHQPALEASRAVYETREKAAAFFGVEEAERVIFTSNATDALNLGIQGIAKPGGHIVVTSMEHNSVLRPVHALSQQNGMQRLDYTVVQGESVTGVVTATQIAAAIRKDTCLVVCTHAANTTGTLMPIQEIASLCREQGIPFLLDASQSAGAYEIHMEDLGVDLMACPGHKGLLGLPGTGLLCLGRDVNPRPIRQGGTGSFSQYLEQPAMLPDRYECGTLNTVGIAALGAGLDWLTQRGLEEIRTHEERLCTRLLEGLGNIPGVTLYGTGDAKRQAAVVLFRVSGIDCSEVAFRLDSEYHICVRAGLHCAYLAHQTIGSAPAGAVRMSIGPFNTETEIDHAIAAVAALIKE